MSRKSIETFILCLILSISIFVLYKHRQNNHKSALRQSSDNSSGALVNLEGRQAWEVNRLKDPATGFIPRNIRQHELEFAKNLPKDNYFNIKSVKWVNRGPYNVGGRSRAIALDIDNENIIISGGVSGGVWRSTDGGASWNEQTEPSHLHSITCIAQDVRPGKHNVWYYGTGEMLGNSASAQGAYFLGNGIYKSSDNGITWESLKSTASNTPQSLENYWDLVWNVALDPTKMDSDVVYAAAIGRIFHSIDGGITWKSPLNSGSYYSIYSDVAVSPKGIVFATFGREDKDVSNGGIFRSPDGAKWFKIAPDSFPDTYQRIVIGINPSDENEVYFFGRCDNKGVLTHSYFGRSERLMLWKYRYLGGDGTGSNGQWTDLSQYLPVYDKKVFNNLYTQNCYDMLVSVKPGNPDVVFIGGTNLYRSTDAFTSKDNISQIGGYEINTQLPDFKIYKNQHPDQHNLVFLPSDPDVMISANDGGLFKTFNNTSSIVEWQSLNNAYNTTQVYTVAIDEKSVSDNIIAGFQDNGNFFTNSTDPAARWVMPLNGDGSFAHITKDGGTYYLSIQEGKIYKMKLDKSGNRTDFRRIDPIGGKNYLFINPFVVDPNNNNIMYVAAGRKLWRNDSLSFIPLENKFDSISKGWFKFKDSLTYPDTTITALAVSTVPPNIVYYGTNRKNVYRLDNANTKDAKRTIITGKSFPLVGNNEGANVSCIAVDPEDANRVFVVFSNYNVYSLFYSKDGGVSWLRVGGNLENNLAGGGPGPSCRWVSILPFPDNKRIYFLGTSTGLYATDQLIDQTSTTRTVWTQIAAEEIGNVVVEMIKTRPLDNLVVVATHGHGVYTAHVNSFEDLASVFDYNRDMDAKLNIYPNPASSSVSISLNLSSEKNAEVYISDIKGSILYHIPKFKFHSSLEKLKINTANLKPGIYLCSVITKNKKYSSKFLIVK